MKSVIYDSGTQQVPVKIWADAKDVEVSALQQLKNVASLPFVFKHVAAMPDVHLGVGATVGSVIATRGAVMPAAVGVDIGCGMMAAKLKIEPQKILDKAKEIRTAIERSVPVGQNKNKNANERVLKWEGWKSFKNLHAPSHSKKGAKELLETAQLQMGSLGGGNHFIELCLDTQGEVWVMLHSGSRNIGNRVAQTHIENAKYEMKMLSIHLPDPDLAYYTEHTKQYDRYMYDLMWCQDYAFQNRIEMMDRVLQDISRVLKLDSLIETEMRVNCHHNYASKENHYGEKILVTRKGAVKAEAGDLGIIPGSMGTKSYIVRGLGNVESFHSCSHGAGRRMSRSEARRRFTVADLKRETTGVECRKDEGVLDEIPSSYKDIDVVMENQKDLVEVVAQLKQFMCVKG